MNLLIRNALKEDCILPDFSEAIEDDTSIYGFQCYYDKNSERGKALAEHITEQVRNGALNSVRNVKTENYQVTRETNIPAVLIEIGYLTNKNERENLLNETYMENLAELIAAGIFQQLSECKEGVL